MPMATPDRTDSARETCERCGAAVRGPVCARCVAGLLVEDEPPATRREPRLSAAEADALEAAAASLEGIEIRARIGAGATGLVLRAYQPQLDRDIALKLLRRSPVIGPREDELRRRFEREARALARLDHPGVVRLLDYGVVGDVPYLMMEWVAGASLRQRLAAGPLPLGEALRIGRQLAESLEALHKAGIVHRDLKPENVVFDAAGGRVRLIDLGLAKFDHESQVGALTGAEHALGTPQYMAPEQWRASHEVGPAADVYALGAVLYELLCGRPPAGHFQPPSAHGVGHAGVDRVIMRALAADPEERWASAASMGQALEVAQALPVQRRSSARWPLALAALAALLLVAALALPGLSARPRLPQAERDAIRLELAALEEERAATEALRALLEPRSREPISGALAEQAAAARDALRRGLIERGDERPWRAALREDLARERRLLAALAAALAARAGRPIGLEARGALRDMLAARARACHARQLRLEAALAESEAEARELTTAARAAAAAADRLAARAQGTLLIAGGGDAGPRIGEQQQELFEPALIFLGEEAGAAVFVLWRELEGMRWRQLVRVREGHNIGGRRTPRQLLRDSYNRGVYAETQLFRWLERSGWRSEPDGQARLDRLLDWSSGLRLVRLIGARAEAVATLKDGAGGVQRMRVQRARRATVSGRVLGYDLRRLQVVTDLGSRRGGEVGQELYLVRSTRLLGRVRIVSLASDGETALGVFDMKAAAPGARPAPGDILTPVPPGRRLASEPARKVLAAVGNRVRVDLGPAPATRELLILRDTRVIGQLRVPRDVRGLVWLAFRDGDLERGQRPAAGDLLVPLRGVRPQASGRVLGLARDAVLLDLGPGQALLEDREWAIAREGQLVGRVLIQAGPRGLRSLPHARFKLLGQAELKVDDQLIELPSRE